MGLLALSVVLAPIGVRAGAKKPAQVPTVEAERVFWQSHLRIVGTSGAECRPIDVPQGMVLSLRSVSVSVAAPTNTTPHFTLRSERSTESFYDIGGPPLRLIEVGPMGDRHEGSRFLDLAVGGSGDGGRHGLSVCVGEGVVAETVLTGYLAPGVITDGGGS